MRLQRGPSSRGSRGSPARSSREPSGTSQGRAGQPRVWGGWILEHLKTQGLGFYRVLGLGFRVLEFRVDPPTSLY